MPLVDAVFRISEFPYDYIICAKAPFAWGSESVIVKFAADASIPPEVKAAGFTYLLEREEVLDVLASCAQKRASRKTVAELVIHYALLDAYPAWLSDLPDK